MSDMTPPRHARLTAARALVADNPLLVVIAGIGFAVSFQTIARLATAQHMPGWPVLYPVLIDVGFLAAVIEERHAIRDGRSDLAPRVLAWVLAALTVYVNAHGSPARDWLGITLHVTAPVLWVAFLELTRWRKVRKARKPTGEEARHARALADARRYAIDLARSMRGLLWRWRVPSLLRRQVLSGRLPAAVQAAVRESLREYGEPWEGAVRAWVLGAEGLNLKMRAEADSKRAAEAIRGEAASAPEPVAQDVPATVPQNVPKSSPRRPRRPSPSAVKRMSAADLAPYVETLLGDAPGLLASDVMKDLKIGREKATEALRLARRSLPTPIRLPVSATR